LPSNTNFELIDIDHFYTYENCDAICAPDGLSCNDENPDTYLDQYMDCDCIGTPCDVPNCELNGNYIPYESCTESNEHFSNEFDSWLSCNETESPNPLHAASHWVMIDLKEIHAVYETHLWNYNVAGETGKGLQNVVIDYSLDGANWMEFSQTQWPEASGNNDYSGFTGPDFQGLNFRFLLISTIDNWSGNDCHGFSEIQLNVETQTGIQVPIRLKMRAFLEGPYAGGNTMNNTMFTDNIMPFNNPYTASPWNSTNDAGTATNFPTTVDWVLIEAYQGSPISAGGTGLSLVESVLGFIQTDGFIHATNGSFDLPFNTLTEGEEYHFILRHRNHLDVLSANTITASFPMVLDFTKNEESALGAEQLKQMTDGVFALYAGDYNGDGVIQTTDNDEWLADPAILNSYETTDGNLDGSVQTTDYDTWLINKAKLGVFEVRY
ncbi:hypothetical protein N8482_03005, partial [Chitinophagales bacterium]|nr:hypothetical protein [Chitinophagales bacterium]